MRTNTNEINIHLLLSNDINRLREAGTNEINIKYQSIQTINYILLKFEFHLALSKLLKLTQLNCNHDSLHHHESM